MDKPPASMLDFKPIKSASRRHDGWTPEKQRAFIECLATIGVVSAAAKAIGMSPKSAYALLKRAPEESGFAQAWSFAIESGRGRALDTAVERAFHGVVTPIFYRGRQIGERRRFNDRLLMAALRYSDPQRYGPSAGGDE